MHGASASNCTTSPPVAGAENGVALLNTIQSCACLRKAVTNDGSGSAWVCRQELERVEVLVEVVFKYVIIYEVYEIDHNSKICAVRSEQCEKQS